MTEVWIYLAPVAAAILGYLIRVESRFTQIQTDICWIKEHLQRRSGDKRECIDGEN